MERYVGWAGKFLNRKQYSCKRGTIHNSVVSLAPGLTLLRSNSVSEMEPFLRNTTKVRYQKH